MFRLFKRKKKIKKEDPIKAEVLEKEEIENFVEDPGKGEPIQEVVEEQEETKEKPKEEKKRKASNHITKHPQGGWQIKKSGASRALKRFKTQKEAIDFAKGLEDTTGTAYVIHKADGRTRKKTY